jgi:hypothetical protein
MVLELTRYVTQQVMEQRGLVDVFNATFNHISVLSWQSILLVEETGGPGENHRPIASLSRLYMTRI